MVLKYRNTEIEFTHIINPKLKRVSISIDSNNNVIVKSPKMSKETISALVLKKAEWILKKQAISRENINNFDFKTGTLLPYLGEKYPIELVEDKNAGVGRTTLDFLNEAFIMTYNPYLMKEEYMQKALDEFYKEKAKKQITELTQTWANKMNIRFGKITFKNVKRSWGSCSPIGNLMFNLALIKLPISCIEYVVVHELAHIKQPSHNKDFWALVSQFKPDYQELRSSMKQYIN